MASGGTQPKNFFRLEAIDRVGSIPVVEGGFKRAETFYGMVKKSNRFFSWYFERAEAVIMAAVDSVQPAVKLLEEPLKRLDIVICKSLDIFEQRMPLVYLPPEMMYWQTKEYMSDHLVKPVLKRADSVKLIGSAVLESPITTYAADRIDGAFSVADRYVDKYLIPVKDELRNEDEKENSNEHNQKGAMKAILHGKRLSRKLKRRLTQRTIAEAKALRKQGKEVIHIIFYAVELILTDPTMAIQKGRELWIYLSEDEPENQERPTTLEELIVLLTRESARRLVHLLIFFSKTFRATLHSAREIIHHIIFYNNNLLKRANTFEEDNTFGTAYVKAGIGRALTFYENFQNLVSSNLENFAIFLSGRIEAEKVSTNLVTTSSSRIRVQSQQNNNSPAHGNINGVY